MASRPQEGYVFVLIGFNGRVHGNYYHTRLDCRHIMNQHSSVTVNQVEHGTADMFGLWHCNACIKADQLSSFSHLIVCKTITESSTLLWIYGKQLRLRPGEYVDPIEMEKHTIPIEVRREIGMQ